MKATYHPGIHRYAVFVVCWTVGLLTAGALVTSEDAALAVPDWPLSYGSLNPPMVGGIAFEHSHRLIAAALGFLVIILAFLLWRKDERPHVRWLGAFAVAGVCLQGGLGGLTVLKLLHYWLPVMHACTAEIVFAMLVSIAVVTSRWWMENPRQSADSHDCDAQRVRHFRAGPRWRGFSAQIPFTEAARLRRTYRAPDGGLDGAGASQPLPAGAGDGPRAGVAAHDRGNSDSFGSHGVVGARAGRR